MMSKDEFRESMRAARAEEEINEILKEIDDPIDDPAEDPEDFPMEILEERVSVSPAKKTRKKPGPKPKKQAEKKTPETAGLKDQIPGKEAGTAKQEEALRAMIALTEGFTQHLIKGSERCLNTADKLADMAQIYTGYIEAVEEMIG